MQEAEYQDSGEEEELEAEGAGAKKGKTKKRKKGRKQSLIDDAAEEDSEVLQNTVTLQTSSYVSL